MAGRRRTKAAKGKPRVKLRKWPRIAAYILVYLLLATSAGLGVWKGYEYFNSSDRFRVAAIDVTGGTPRISREIAARLEGLMGLRTLEINPGQVRDLLLEDKRLGDAEVFLQLPQTIKVRLTEREVAGLARVDDTIYMLDPDGVMICSYQKYGGMIDAPVITGLDTFENREEATRKGMQALSDIKAASLFFWDNIETLDVSDSDNMVVRLRSQTAPVYLGDKVIAANVSNYLSIAQHIQEKYPELDYIELGFPDQVAIMPKNH